MELNNTKVSLIPDSQISSAGILLTEAFFADPLNQYVFPDPEERMQERARHSGLDQMQRQFGPQAYQRFTGVINHFPRFRSQVAPPAHWYLSLIGVSPSCQGQGIGGALLAPVLLKADKEGTCCLLETFEEKKPFLLPTSWVSGGGRRDRTVQPATFLDHE
jgi:GNAT superfamily N-acetyltransferase